MTRASCFSLLRTAVPRWLRRCLAASAARAPAQVWRGWKGALSHSARAPPRRVPLLLHPVPCARKEGAAWTAWLTRRTRRRRLRRRRALRRTLQTRQPRAVRTHAAAAATPRRSSVALRAAQGRRGTLKRGVHSVFARACAAADPRPAATQSWPPSRRTCGWCALLTARGAALAARSHPRLRRAQPSLALLFSRPQVANEPSVGLYFIQEHVRKSIPFVMATKARHGGAGAAHCARSDCAPAVCAPHAAPRHRRASATLARRRRCASAPRAAAASALAAARC